MKICLFSTDFLPNIGGIANHVAELGKALVKLGHNVVVVTKCRFIDTKGFSYEAEMKAGMKIIRVPIIHIPKIAGINMRISYLYYLKKILKEYKIDVLHWHTLSHNDCYVTKKIDFRNLVFTNHSSTFLNKFESGYYNQLQKYFFHAKEIIAPSKELVKKTIELGYPEDNTHYISNGVDIDRFNKDIDVDDLREKLNINGDDKVVICARRFAKKNGVIYLVKAIPLIVKKSNVNVKFVFVGDWPESHPNSEKREIFNYVENNNLRKHTIFAGEIPSEEMPRYYSLGDISVLPSLKEATSLSGLESMACGVPVVGTNVGGIPEIIRDEINGILVPPKNSVELSKSILEILNNTRKREKFSINCREFVKKNYSWIKIAKETVNVYKRLIR